MRKLPSFPPIGALWIAGLLWLSGCDMMQAPIYPIQIWEASEEGYTSIDEDNLIRWLFTVDAEALSEAEKNSLYVICEGERLTKKITGRSFDHWGEPLFYHLKKCERSHEKSFQPFFSRYYLDAALLRDSFLFPDHQALYEILAPMTKSSLVEAYLANAQMFEKSYYDLDGFLKGPIDNADIATLYESLQMASSNHLYILVQALEEESVIYQPHYLSPEVFEWWRKGREAEVVSQSY